MRDAFISELSELAREDHRIFLVVGDLGFSVIEDFATEFPDRFLNPGVAEQAMIGIAAGLAASGYRVFVYSIGNFPTLRCLEQIRNDVCYHNRDVTVVAVGGGFSYGYLGYTHHAIEDLSIMRALPGMTVFSPADPAEARSLTRRAAVTPGPSYLRLGKNREPVLARVNSNAPADSPGLLRDGEDVLILTTGAIAGTAVEAADLLGTEGVGARVVTVPVVKPLPDSIDDHVQDTRALVVVEENTTVGGLGAAVLERCAERGLLRPTRLLGTRESEVSGHIGSQDYMRARHGLDAASIAASATALLEGGA
jgi:transketolase